MIILVGLTFFEGKKVQKINSYSEIIISYARKYCLQSELLFAIIERESGFDKNARSKKGACGLMQIMPETAHFLAERIGYGGVIDLFNVDCNLTLGCEYVTYLAEKFTNETTLLCAYNAGEGVVLKWLKNTNYSNDGVVLNNIPYKETRNYVKKVEKSKKKFKLYLKLVNNYE